MLGTNALADKVRSTSFLRPIQDRLHLNLLKEGMMLRHW